MGDIGEVADLFSSIFKYVTDPAGYSKSSIQSKCEQLHDAAIKAINSKDYDALDFILAEFRRLREKII